MPKNLETDKDGKLIVNPDIGWTTGTLAEVGVLLAIDYSERPQDIETGGKSVQLGLTPQQSLELAQKLTTLANKLLNPPPASKTH